MQLNLSPYDKDPKYIAISKAIINLISEEEIKPGEKLPTHRSLAESLGVTAGTISKAYDELEQQGFVSARVGSGTYVRNHEIISPPFPYSQNSSCGQIDLSLGLPPGDQLRTEAMRKAVESVSRNNKSIADSIIYHAPNAFRDQKSKLSTWFKGLGIDIHPDESIISLGGQHGIYLALNALVRPGECIAAESLTYPGFINAAQQACLKVKSLPLDQGTLNVHALEKLCERAPPRIVYVSPDQNNPTGAFMPEETRDTLAFLAKKYGFWILEDGVQYLPPSSRGTPLHTLAPDNTIFIASLSKILAGGLRVGLVKAPASVLSALTESIRSHHWMPAPLMVDIACQWIISGDADRVLNWQLDELHHRQKLTKSYLYWLSVSGNPYGSYVWVNMPDGLRSTTVVDSLASQGVLVAHSEPFCVGNTPAPQAFRISTSAASSRGELTHALKIINSTLREASRRL
ncbi:hypothetical protein BFW38_08095 [Terasakiispira papahanaumokuakeensis]|uniref:HTH gntR-type domain-containing protein n=1 Tax=Terasakiispira papahanaumokuakeensis TaxID=197479 RepID=A0A1E2VA33_9GAMM|nr:PLP-dependent aminotransferase family protein [Terasakiispira papahanaumokuakeensis]ODC03515.1 hypothetical protein BFW38_08095 [Terasakiispira papahanaumokuakeensis]